VENCIFCKIVSGQIQSKLEYETPDLAVIQDINPQAPVHILIIPKKHIERVDEIGPLDLPLAAKMIEAAKKVALQNGWRDYRLVFNNGPEAGQTVFHIHLHLLSGRPMLWPPG
jgi:histidine triad (HIT) family protein